MTNKHVARRLIALALKRLASDLSPINRLITARGLLGEAIDLLQAKDTSSAKRVLQNAREAIERAEALL